MFSAKGAHGRLPGMAGAPTQRSRSSVRKVLPRLPLRPNMTRMHNPPHPGEVLREYLGNTTVTEAAIKLGVNRVTLSRVVTGASGISADMAYRLADAFDTSPEP